MYQLVRRIHLFSGSIIMAFLMMYFVSGYMMIHRPWFLRPLPPATVETAPLEAGLPVNVDQLAVYVKEKFQLRGRLQYPQTQPKDGKRFWVLRPGVMLRVDVPADQRQITFTNQRAGLVGTLIMLHKVRGYDDQWLFDLYALFCDLAGLSMILFAVSGVYLWWKRTRNRTWGIVCLGASCVYGMGMVLYLAYAP
jgi:hypothetical protein